MKHPFRCLLVAGGIAAAGLVPLIAVAGDNSGIVVIEQQHQGSPYGRYDSRRRLQVYGPASGFRYEEHRYPLPRVPVYPGYGRRYDHFSPHGYSHSRSAPPSAAPYAPRFGAGRYHDRHRHDYGFGRHGSRLDKHHYHGDYSSGYGDNRFGHSPSQRAMRPARRAIEPARRAIGR